MSKVHRWLILQFEAVILAMELVGRCVSRMAWVVKRRKLERSIPWLCKLLTQQI